MFENLHELEVYPLASFHLIKPLDEKEKLIMARGFTKKEKDVIKSLLIQEGKKLFGKLGLKKTNIAQLTSAAGISPATFYQFYHSKEDLYFAIFQEVSEKTQAYLVEASIKKDKNPNASVMENLLLIGKDMIQADPFLRQLLIGEDLKQVLKTRSAKEIESHLTKDYEQFLPLIQSLQNQGDVKHINPDVLTAVIQMYFLMHEHQEKFGVDIFNQSMQLLARSISLGISNNST